MGSLVLNTTGGRDIFQGGGGTEEHVCHDAQAWAKARWPRRRQRSCHRAAGGRCQVFSVSLSFVCLPVWCCFTSRAEMDMFLCLGGGSGGEIQAASLSCVKQKRATGQLCFRPE